MTARKSTVVILVVIALIAVGGSLFIFFGRGEKRSQPALEKQPVEESVQGDTAKFKILHVMSYHSPWKWTDDQFDGFKAALEGLDVEYKVIQMDTKHHSSEEWKEQVGQEARDLIDTWQPDLVYANDDDAQEYVTRYYVNKEIPFVFSGVNADPAQWGFVGSTNVTGVLEHQHFVQTVQLLKKIAPDVKKIAVVVDDSPFWDSVTQEMREEENLLPDDVEIVRWDTIYTFEEYQQKVKEYQTTVDAIALIGVFNFKDEKGDHVPFEEVLKWTAENSNLPDFSFWKDRISHGTLCSVTVSGYEQGLAAGNIARGILVEGRSPASYPMEPTVKGEPVVSLARAKKLGLTINSEILLTAEIVEKFSWTEE